MAKKISNKILKFKEGEESELLRGVTYESSKNTQTFQKGSRFIVEEDRGKVLDVRFVNFSGLFMVYKQDVKKV